MIVGKYFEMVFDDISPGGNADAPDEFYYNRHGEIMKMNSIPFSFQLDNNIFEDFVMNNLDIPLMSPSLKVIFDQYKNSAPLFKWLTIKVVSKNGGQSLDYFLLVFEEKPDVLDFDKTRLIDGDYIYGFFSYQKIKNYSFFPQPRDFDASLIVSESLKTKIAENNIKGVSFRIAEIT